MTHSDAIGRALTDFLDQTTTADIARALKAIARAATPVSKLIRRGALAGPLGEAVGAANQDGDSQKALDLLADIQFCEGMRGYGIRALVSEETAAPTQLDPEGRLLMAIDPLDGSSNIDTNIPIGTIFSILPAPEETGPVEEAAFLQPGHRQLAAGFVIYGAQTSFVFSTGSGTHIAVLDPETDRFVMTQLSLVIPEGSREFAINASNYRHWHPPVQAYIDDCVEGADGPRGKNFNMRWIASLVADAYRIVVRGGVFLYPGDRRKGYERGRLRHLYEASPIAFLSEQASGGATDGVNRILDAVPRGIHERIPFVFGSLDKVMRIRRYHLETEDSADRSPLFGRRGLLRA
ncbi:MAG: class 1 fructose-bisphosphatase [Labrys sp. (in: a-proteobacteria)]|jgi:fructose-1,6-bisphosphatase I